MTPRLGAGLSLLGRTAGGFQAFATGRVLGEEIAAHRLPDELRKVRARETPLALALFAVALALALRAAWKKKELVVLAAAGALVGSGAIDRVLTRADIDAPAWLAPRDPRPRLTS